MPREFASGIQHAEVAALPAATANPRVTLSQGGKLWFSDGTNWVDLGAAAQLGTATPAALGTAAPGAASAASREDHVHPMPTAAQVGADPAGTGASQAAVAVDARIQAGTTTGQLSRWNQTTGRYEPVTLNTLPDAADDAAAAGAGVAVGGLYRTGSILKVRVVTVPGAPTIGTATAGDTQATVTFTAPASDGGSPITGYRVTSTPGGITATGAASPITVTGLTNGTAYTFTVAAQNAIGFSAESAASNSVTPTGVVINLTGFNTNPGPESSMGFRVRRDGVLQHLIGGATGPTVADQWVSSGATATIGDAYEVSFNGGATWTQINTDRDVSNGLEPITIAIRPFGGGTTLASATYTFNS